MQFDLIQCTVRLNEDGNFGSTEVVKAGPGAVRASEIPILRFLHDVEGGFDQGTCCIASARVVGQVEGRKSDEMDRLAAIYGTKVVSAVYPGGRGVPETMRDCDLPEGTFVRGSTPKAAPKPEPDGKGNISVDKDVPLPEGA